MIRVISGSNPHHLLKAFIICALLAWPVLAWAAGGSYNDCIRKNENRGNDPKIMNDFGYVGLYQMGVQAAMDSGICTPKSYTTKYGVVNGKTVPVQDWSQCDFNGPIAEKYGINSVDDLRNSPNAGQAQEDAQNKFNDRIDGYVSKYKDRIGETVNGVVITEDTLRALYHLKGGGGLAAFMSGEDPTDGNGTHMSDYAKCLQDCMNGTGTGECKYDRNDPGGLCF